MIRLTRILTRGVRIRAADAQSSAVGRGRATKATGIVLIRPECMLHPGLTNLFKAFVVGRSTAHPIQILRNDRVVGIWQLKEMHGLISTVARGRSDSQADLTRATSKLGQTGHIAYHDIGPVHKSWSIGRAATSGRQYR